MAAFFSRWFSQKKEKSTIPSPTSLTCNVFLMSEASEWVQVRSDSVSLSQGHVIDLSPSHPSFPVSSISQTCRFVDSDDGRTCVQFKVIDPKSGPAEYGLRFKDRVDADTFAEAVAEHSAWLANEVGAEYKDLLEISHSDMQELVESGWESIGQQVPVKVLKRVDDCQCFLVVGGGSSVDGSNSAEPVLFSDSIAASMNFKFSAQHKTVTFLGFSFFKDGCRFFRLVFKDLVGFRALKNCITAALEGDRKEEDSSVRLVAEDSDFEDPPSDDECPVVGFESYSEHGSSEEEDVTVGSRTAKVRLSVKTSKNAQLATSAKNCFIFRKHVSGSYSVGNLQTNSTLEMADSLGEIRSPFLNRSDAEITLLTQGGGAAVVDSTTGQIVRHWTPSNNPAISSVAPQSKDAENGLFFAIGDKSVQLVDPRISNSTALSFSYATPVGLSSACTDSSGHLAIGARDGAVRLFDGTQGGKSGLLKRAKSLLPGLGQAVSHAELTNSGDTIVCTCGNFILVMGLTNGNTSGFEKSLSGSPSFSTTLTISPEDAIKYKIKRMEFTAATIDPEEKLITSTVGNLAVAWDLAKAKKGKSAYQIQKLPGEVLQSGWSRGEVVALFRGEGVARLRKKA